jgi:hypothetical protein
MLGALRIEVLSMAVRNYTGLLLSIPSILALALPVVLALGCGDSGATNDGGTGGFNIDLDGGVPMGCVALEVPPEEPHLTGTPSFAEDFVLPTLPVEAQVGVDAETRTMKVELINVFFRDRPPVGTIQEQAGGARTFSLTFPTEADTEGMFVMEVTLCAGDCEEESFVYTFEGDFPETYQRLHFERNTEVGRMETCINIPRVVVD